MIKINLKKHLGFEFTTGEILRLLQKKALVKFSILINVLFKLRCLLSMWRIAEVILILKLDQTLNDVIAYRQMLVFPVMSKLFENLLYF